MKSRLPLKTLFLRRAAVFVLSLLVMAAVAKAAPGAPEDMKLYENNVGKSYRFTITGTTVGSVWGTDVYTADSFLSTAAVHAGAIKKGVTQEVEVMVVAGQPSYKGSSRNDVTTGDWGSFNLSYRFVKKGAADAVPAKAPVVAETPASAAPTAAPTAAPAKKPAGERAPDGPANMYILKDEVGKTFKFTVKGTKYGVLLGTGTYTADTVLSTAAVHAGLVGLGEEGEVEVIVLPRQSEFKGSTNNGLTSDSYSESSACYKFKTK